jgi:hypothetical protein
MALRKFVALFAFCICVGAHAESQIAASDLKGLREVEQSVTKLPAPTRSAIQARLHMKASQLRAEQVHVPAGDLYVVQGAGDFCGAANCDIWILSSAYEVILHGTTQGFNLLATSHGGVPDVVTSMHGSAFESEVTRWEFDGSQYRRIACANVNYMDEDGNEYDLPHIRPKPCRRK